VLVSDDFLQFVPELLDKSGLRMGQNLGSDKMDGLLPKMTKNNGSDSKVRTFPNLSGCFQNEVGPQIRGFEVATTYNLR